MVAVILSYIHEKKLLLRQTYIINHGAAPERGARLRSGMNNHYLRLLSVMPGMFWTLRFGKKYGNTKYEIRVKYINPKINFKIELNS